MFDRRITSLFPLNRAGKTMVYSSIDSYSHCHLHYNCILQDKFKGELFRAWDLVVKFIIQRLQDGYMAAKAQKDEQDRSFTNDQHHDQVHIDLHLDRDNDHDGSTAARNI